MPLSRCSVVVVVVVVVVAVVAVFTSRNLLQGESWNLVVPTGHAILCKSPSDRNLNFESG